MGVAGAAALFPYVSNRVGVSLQAWSDTLLVPAGTGAVVEGELVALAAIVVAGQVLTIAAVVVSLADIALLTAAALLVPAASRLAIDDRDLDRRWESRVDTGSSPLTTQTFQTVIARRTRVILVAGSLAVVPLVLALTLRSETGETQEGQRATHGSLDN